MPVRFRLWSSTFSPGLSPADIMNATSPGCGNRNRRAEVVEAFRSSALAPRVTFSEERAGLHFLLRLDTGRSDAELYQLAARMGVRLGFLSEYAAVSKPEFAHTLVINYAGLSPQRLPEAIRLLSEVLLPLL